jgi:hypothetical protein
MDQFNLYRNANGSGNGIDENSPLLPTVDEPTTGELFDDSIPF